MTAKRLFIFSNTAMKTLHILRYFSFCLVLAVSSMAYAQCPNLVWSDEFDGTQLDLSKWEPQIGDGCNYGICQWGNNELQFYKAENAGGGNKRGTATITIHDDLEIPVSGATVYATFSGTFSDTASGQTGPDGTVTLTTADTARGGVTVNLCVGDVTHATLSYNAAENDITCSGGTDAIR